METEIQATTKNRPYIFVLTTGLISTGLTLFGVYWLNENVKDFGIMGWYADYIFPVGALIVGFLAGSGYGLASWFTGLRIGRWLLVTVLVLQTGAYFSAEYIEYRDLITNAGYEPTVQGFVHYYDYKARNFAWQDQHDSKKSGDPLGASGYFFVLLGAAGFILSGLIAPAILMAVPYCDQCQRYKSTKKVGTLPASVAIRKISKADFAGKQTYDGEQAQALQSGDEILQRMREAARAGNVDQFRQELTSAGDRKANDKLPRRIEISLIWCKTCEGGTIQPTVLNGHGKQITRAKLVADAASPELVRALLQ